jgi:hypothetical protein
MSLLPHQQRVVEEREDLFNKLFRLRLFIQSSAFQEIDLAEQSRLELQHKYMFDYLGILDLRIEAFGFVA